MAPRPDTLTGTVTLTSGQAAFTTTGVNMLTRGHQPGDTIYRNGFALIIGDITGENTGVLLDVCPADAAGVDVPVRIRFQPDGSRVAAMVRDLMEMLGNGTLQSLADQDGSAGQLIPMFNGPNSFVLVPRVNLISGVDVDANVADIAARAVYDTAVANFTVLVADIGDGRSALYTKLSATNGDWSLPAYFTGPVGATFRGAYAAETTYAVNDIVTLNGSSFRKLTTAAAGTSPSTANPPVNTAAWEVIAAKGTTGDIGPVGATFRGEYDVATTYAVNDIVTLNGSSFRKLTTAAAGTSPSTANPPVNTAAWEVLAAKGVDGTGAGDVLGPPVSAVDRIATFDDESGTRLKDSGKTLADYQPVIGPTVDLDAHFLTLGTATERFNALTINGEQISDGGGDYGLTIRSYEPGIALIDRDTGAGSALIRTLTDGTLEIVQDSLNDGTIGYTSNTTDIVVASFASAAARLSGELTVPTIRVSSSADADLTSTAHPLQIGPTTGVNVVMDNDGLFSRNNGALAPWNVNATVVTVNAGLAVAGPTVFRGVNWATNAFTIEGAAPAVFFKQTDLTQSALVGVNEAALYVLSDPEGDGTFAGAPFPFEVGLTSNRALVGGKTVKTSAYEFGSVTAMIADAVMAYAAAPGKVIVFAGEIVTANAFSYEVLGSGATGQHLTTAGGVKLRHLFQGCLNVKALGALGNGTGSDHAIINQAISIIGAMSTGGVVYLPAGDYRITTNILLNAHRVTLMGDGMERTRITLATASMIGVLMRHSAGIATAIEYSRIVGISFYGTATALSVISVQNHSNCYIEDIRIFVTAATGIDVYNGTVAYNLYMSRVYIQQTTNTGIALGNNGTGDLQNVFMEDVHANDANNYGVHVLNCGGLVWDRGETLYSGIGLCIIATAGKGVGRVKGVRISNVFFDTSDTDNMIFSSSGAAAEASEAVFVNCSFNNAVAGAGVNVSTGAGVTKKTNSIAFIGCSFIINKKYGIYLNNVTSVDINVPQVISNGDPGGTIGAQPGIEIITSTDVRIFGGSSGGNPNFGDRQNYGVRLSNGCTGIRIRDVDLTGNTVGAVGPFGSGQEMIIAGCIGYNTYYKGVAYLDTGSTTVNHNLNRVPTKDDFFIVAAGNTGGSEFYTDGATATTVTFVRTGGVAHYIRWMADVSLIVT